MFQIVRFGENDYGVYARGYRNSYGTSLAFRGTLDECLAWRRAHS